MNKSSDEVPNKFRISAEQVPKQFRKVPKMCWQANGTEEWKNERKRGIENERKRGTKRRTENMLQK